MTIVYKILIYILACILFPCISNAQKNNLRIDHLTIDDGLSHNHIFEILQDHRGFMWFATDKGGVNKINPVTGHVAYYLHNPGNSNTISDNAVESIFQDSYGNFWFGTLWAELNKFEPATETFTRFVKDIDGQLIVRVTKIIEGNRKNIWFTSDKGLFHLNPQTGSITRPSATISIISVDHIYEDKEGILWILVRNPATLIKCNPATEQLTKYPCNAIGLWSCNLIDDRKQGFWISSNKGLCYFSRQTEEFSFILHQDETNTDGLNDNFIFSI